MRFNIDPSSWKRVIFGEVVANVNDYFDAKRDGRLPYVAGPHINSGDPTVAGYGSTDDDRFPPTFKRKFRDGDVLLHSRGIDKLAAVDRAGVTGEKLFVLRSLDERVLLQDYLLWLLLGPEAQARMKDNFTGSVNKFLNWKPLASLEFSLPPLDEQKRIADLLWMLERHRRAVAETGVSVDRSDEAWLESVYSTPGQPHVSVADLIADGAIRLLTGPFGSALASSEYTTYGVPVIHPSFIVDGRLTVDEKSFVSPGTASRLSRWQVMEGDIVFMRKRDVTRSGIVTPDERGWILGSDCILVRVDQDRLCPDYVRAMLRSPSARAELLRRAPGTAMPGINERSLSALQLPLVTLTRQREVVADWQSFEQARLGCRREISQLFALRSSLLADIFGGN